VVALIHSHLQSLWSNERCC